MWGAASSSVTTKETLLAVMRTSGARLGGMGDHALIDGDFKLNF